MGRRLRRRPLLRLPPRGPPSAQRRHGVDTRPVHNLTTAPTCLCERKSRTSEAGSQKRAGVERAGVKLGEAGVSRPDTPRAWASDASGQPSCERKGEAVGGNGACSSSEHTERGESWLDVAGVGKVGAVRAVFLWPPHPHRLKSRSGSEGSGPSVPAATVSPLVQVWSRVGAV